MSKNSENLFTRSLVHQIAEMNAVFIKQDLQYAKNKNDPLFMDIYYPDNTKPNKLKPAIIFVTGYPDPGFKAMTGYKLHEVEQYISWSRFMAASGIIAITYTNIDPEKDVKALLDYIFNHAESQETPPMHSLYWCAIKMCQYNALFYVFDITDDKKYSHETIETIMFFIKSKLTC